MTFRDLQWSVANKAGLVPQEAEGLPLAVAVQITDAINTAMRYCWNRYDWPPLCTVSPVTLVPHARGSLHLPAAAAPETVFSFHEADPTVCETREVRHWQDPDGFHFAPSTSELVWMRARPAAPAFSAIDYRDDATYRAGDVVYFEAHRNCYRVKADVASVTGTAPPEASVWEAVPVPPFLGEAVKAAALALFQNTEGQHGTAALLAEAADTLLDEEIDRFEFQQARRHKPWR